MCGIVGRAACSGGLGYCIGSRRCGGCVGGYRHVRDIESIVRWKGSRRGLHIRRCYGRWWTMKCSRWACLGGRCAGLVRGVVGRGSGHCREGCGVGVDEVCCGRGNDWWMGGRGSGCRSRRCRGSRERRCHRRLVVQCSCRTMVYRFDHHWSMWCGRGGRFFHGVGCVGDGVLCAMWSCVQWVECCGGRETSGGHGWDGLLAGAV